MENNNNKNIVLAEEKVALEEHNFVNQELEKEEDKKDGSETPEMRICFKELQAFSACFDAFAHGGNDVGWAIQLLFLFCIYLFESITKMEVYIFCRQNLLQKWEGGNEQYK